MTLETIFKAYDIRATYPDQLNEQTAWKVGYATGRYLKRNEDGARGGTVLVGRDMRPHSPPLCAALAEGLLATGLGVIDLGRCDTSFVYWAINDQNAIGGVQTTASHNPIEYNGFKISGHQARPIGGDTGLAEIQQIAASLPNDFGPGKLEVVGTYEQRDLWASYRKHILGFLKPLPRPVKVFVDASNGMAGELVPKVFGEVENLQIIDLNFETAGHFAHEPNPLVPKNMVPTQQGVRQHGADFGVCFDGDADRCILTDEKGQIIGCDHFTALLCEHFLQQAPGAAIVYDLRCSKAVEEQIRHHRGSPHRSRVGHVFMKSLIRQVDGIFGGELSGHFYFRDNFYTDSGAIAFASLLDVLGHCRKPLSELIRPLKKYPQSGELNFRVEDKQAVLAALKDRYADGSIDELDGVLIDCFDAKGWWFNVRPSNTEPLLRLNAEATDQSTLDTLLQEMKPLLGEPAVGH